jgi:hypothetical protein
MLNINKYITVSVTQEDLNKVFTPEIVQKSQEYSALFSQERKQENLEKFFNDENVSVIMGFFIENNQEDLFFYLEREANELSSQKGRLLINFDWEIVPGLSFANYYFIRHYHRLYFYDYSRRQLKLDRDGYALSLLAYSSFKPWDVGDLPFGKLMKKDFYQDEYQ